MSVDIDLAIRQALQEIPKGKVMTYKSLASRFGVHPRKVAMVMKYNPLPEVYPCYKVVASDGSLSGYSAPGGVQEKIRRLREDGVRLDGDTVHPDSII